MSTNLFLNEQKQQVPWQVQAASTSTEIPCGTFPRWNCGSAFCPGGIEQEHCFLTLGAFEGAPSWVLEFVEPRYALSKQCCLVSSVGPYMLGTGLLLYLLSKEIYVVNHETAAAACILTVIIYGIKKFGGDVAAFADKLNEVTEKLQFDFAVFSKEWFC